MNPTTTIESLKDDTAQFRLQMYKKRIESKGLPFDLPYARFRELLFSPCFYCGSPSDSGQKNSFTGVRSHGIDRVDSAQGYIEGNVVTACILCNDAKSDESLDSWLSRIRAIAENTKHLPCPSSTSWTARTDLAAARTKSHKRGVRQAYSDLSYYKRRNHE